VSGYFVSNLEIVEVTILTIVDTISAIVARQESRGDKISIIIIIFNIFDVAGFFEKDIKLDF